MVGHVLPGSMKRGPLCNALQVVKILDGTRDDRYSRDLSPCVLTAPPSLSFSQFEDSTQTPPVAQFLVCSQHDSREGLRDRPPSSMARPEDTVFSRENRDNAAQEVQTRRNGGTTRHKFKITLTTYSGGRAISIVCAEQKTGPNCSTTLARTDKPR